jgi:deoxyribonuclease-1
MADTYGINYSKRQLQLFKEWNIQDPISKQEIAHNKRVVKAQGFGIK